MKRLSSPYSLQTVVCRRVFSQSLPHLCRPNSAMSSFDQARGLRLIFFFQLCFAKKTVINGEKINLSEIIYWFKKKTYDERKVGAKDSSIKP